MRGLSTIVLATALVILGCYSCLSSAAFARHAPLTKTVYFNVKDYGAVGNGQTDDSDAFMEAWENVCKANSSVAVLQIPRRNWFLLKNMRFEGPCKATSVKVEVLGNIVAPKMKPAWEHLDKGVWIMFSKIDGLTVRGTGTIDGQGHDWWELPCIKRRENNCFRPKAVAFHDCTNLYVSGVKIRDTPKSHISINSCDNVKLSQITLIAPKDSPNTDGIDISSSSNIIIQDSFIGVGDDCVAINGGSSNINITNIACGPGHGISVGSLGHNGEYDTVEAVFVRNCNLTRTTNGLRIKTWQGGAGYARNITFEHIKFTLVKNPIIIDQYYFSDGDSKEETQAVKISDITYKSLYGSSTSKETIVLRCSQVVPCTNIVMNHINITPVQRRHKISSNCLNAKGHSKATVPPVHCLH